MDWLVISPFLGPVAAFRLYVDAVGFLESKDNMANWYIQSRKDYERKVNA